jgi:hypothetical protein
MRIGCLPVQAHDGIGDLPHQIAAKCVGSISSARATGAQVERRAVGEVDIEIL